MPLPYKTHVAARSRGCKEYVCLSSTLTLLKTTCACGSFLFCCWNVVLKIRARERIDTGHKREKRGKREELNRKERT